MAADFSDSADASSEIQAVTAGLGQRLLHRAASPGVIHPVQRRPFPRGNELAAEIQRRWASVDWEYGSDLPYFGFGRPLTPVPSPTLTQPPGEGRPLPAATRGVPAARTVGASAVSPAAQALSGLGSSLQRRHLGGHGGSAIGVVQRRAMASTPSRTTVEVALRPLTPDPSPTPTRPPGEGRPLPPEMPVVPLSPSPERGMGVKDEGQGGIGADFEPPKGAPARSPGREPRVEGASLVPKPPEGATAQVLRSVDPEATSNLLAPRQGLENHDNSQTRGSRPGLRAGAPFGGSKSAPRGQGGEGIVQRKVASRSSGFPDLPLQRMGGAAVGSPVEPVRNQVGAEPSRGVQPVAEMGPAIVQRAARRGVVQRAGLTTASAGPAQMQRITGSSSEALALVPFPSPTLPPGEEGQGGINAQSGVLARADQGFKPLATPVKIVPKGTTPPIRPLQGSAFPGSQGFQSLAASARRQESAPMGRGEGLVQRAARRGVVGSMAGTGAVLPLVQPRRLSAGSGATESTHPLRASGSVQRTTIARPAPSAPLPPAFPFSLAPVSAAPVQMRRAAVQESELADAGFSLPTVQLRRLAVQHTTDASLAPAGVLPLAPPATLIQRQDNNELRGTTTLTASPGMEALLGVARGAAQPAAAEKLDLDDLVERVMCRLTRSLEVESERHGGQRWL